MWQSVERVMGRAASARGTSVLDVLMVLAVMAIGAGMAMAQAGRAVTDVREAGAARAFAMRIRQLRAEAVQRSTAVGLRFALVDEETQFRAHVDGNGNGLRTREMTTGVDPPLSNGERLAPASHGVRFGLAAAVPMVDEDDDGAAGGAGGGGTEGGAGSGGGAGAEDPIRLGASDLLSFGPVGSGTSGTIYLRGPTRQFAVRIYGVTGRIRLLEYRRESGTWVDR